MRLGPVEILLLCLGTVVVTLLVLWVRQEFIDWRATRHRRPPARISRRK